MTMNDLALWGTFLSGIGALAALVISITQINKDAKFNEANFWLSLREIFHSKDRLCVHHDLRDGKWKDNIPLDNHELVKIEDYLGLFEICERMLEREVIDEKMFRSLYEYRIYNFLTNKALARCKLVYEHYDWEYFYKLLRRLYGGQWIDFYDFLKKMQIDYNAIKSEKDLLFRLNERQKEEYENFKKKLKLS